MSDHGYRHRERVRQNALKLAAATPGADVQVALLFALLHDAFRENEWDDPEHGARAAEYARATTLFASGRWTDRGRLDLLCYALEHHDRGAVAIDPTVGVCWDADRLDLGRVGIALDPALFSTEAGRQLAKEET